MRFGPRREINSTPLGLEMNIGAPTQGSREDAATLGWRMQPLWGWGGVEPRRLLIAMTYSAARYRPMHISLLPSRRYMSPPEKIGDAPLPSGRWFLAIGLASWSAASTTVWT